MHALEHLEVCSVTQISVQCFIYLIELGVLLARSIFGEGCSLVAMQLCCIEEKVRTLYVVYKCGETGYTSILDLPVLCASTFTTENNLMEASQYQMALIKPDELGNFNILVDHREIHWP